MITPDTFKRQLIMLGKQHDQLAKASSVTQAKENLRQLGVLESELLDLEQSVADAVRSNSDVDSSRSTLSALLGQVRQGLAVADGTRGAAKARLDEYRDVLNVARSLRSIIGQVTIPQLEALIVRQEQGAEPVNYRKYIRSKAWKQKAEEAKERVDNRCQFCNRSRDEIQLDAHHRTYERLGNELPEDITILCRDCHQLFEDNKKAITKSRACAKCRQTFVPLAASHLFCDGCFTEQRARSRASAPAKSTAQSGYCIRCKTELALDPQAPYCKRCYTVWKKYANKVYEEKFCHVCGQAHTSNMLKSVCYACYKVTKDKLAYA